MLFIFTDQQECMCQDGDSEKSLFALSPSNKWAGREDERHHTKVRQMPVGPYIYHLLYLCTVYNAYYQYKFCYFF